MGSFESKEQIISKCDEKFIKKCLKQNKLTEFELICLILNTKSIMIEEEKFKKERLKTVCNRVNYRVVSSFEMVYHTNMFRNILKNESSHLTRLFFKISNPSSRFQIIEFQTPVIQFIKNIVYRSIELKLEIAEQYAPRKDLPSFYNIHIFLYDEYFNRIDSFAFNDKLASRNDCKWLPVNNIFNITKPFKYVFIHRGKELPFVEKLQLAESQVANRTIRFII